MRYDSVLLAAALAMLLGCDDGREGRVDAGARGEAECRDAAACGSVPSACIDGGCEPDGGRSVADASALDAGRDGHVSGPDPDAASRSDAGVADAGAEPDAMSDAASPDHCPGDDCELAVISLDGRGEGQPCALRRNGALLCVDTPSGEPPVFTAVGTFEGAVQVVRGTTMTCVRYASGRVQCFGSGEAPADVAGLDDAVHVDTWMGHACAARATGVVSCWGDNSLGQIEEGGAASYDAPYDIAGVTTAVQVATSRLASCALLIDGTVACWSDGFGAAPTPVAAVSDAAAITGGQFHFCATRASGSVQCFGGSRAGLEATAPSGITSAAETVALHSETCYRTEAGAVFCWGTANQPGKTEPPPLELIVGLDNAVLLANRCALRESGTVTCWRERSELLAATGL